MEEFKRLISKDTHLEEIDKKAAIAADKYNLAHKVTSIQKLSLRGRIQ